MKYIATSTNSIERSYKALFRVFLNNSYFVNKLKEELDIESNIKSFYTEAEYQYNTFHLTMFCYDVEIVSGKIKLNVHKDSKWINIENLMDLDWAEADIPIVKKLISDFS